MTLGTDSELIDSKLHELLALGILWAKIDTFHPFLAYRKIDWDGALISALDTFFSSGVETSYREIVTEMLVVLEDPLTYVHVENSPLSFEVKNEPQIARQLLRVENGIAIFDLRCLQLGESWSIKEEFRDLIQNLTDVNSVLFDLRGHCSTTWDDLEVLFDDTMASFLCNVDVLGPTVRSRSHSGFAPEIGDWGYYYSTFSVRHAKQFKAGIESLNLPTFFLVNEYSRLPQVAVAMQCGGANSNVVSDKHFVYHQENIATTVLDLPNTLKVQLRLEESQFACGAATFDPAKKFDTDLGIHANITTILDWISGGAPEKIEACSKVYMPGLKSSKTFSPIPFPRLEDRLLAAFRIWGIINYFFPYKDLMNRNWDLVLFDFLPKFMSAKNENEYVLAVSEMVEHLNDSHVNVNCLRSGSVWGAAALPFTCKFVEERLMITKIFDGHLVETNRLRVGDEIISIDDETSQQKRDALASYIAASTPQSLSVKTCDIITLGENESTAALEIKTPAGEKKLIHIQRLSAWIDAQYAVDNSNSVSFRLLEEENIGYVDVQLLMPAMVDEMFTLFADARGIIFDMRGYPNNTMISIAERLCRKNDVPAVKFSRPVVNCPSGRYHIYDSVKPLYQTFFQHVFCSTRNRYEGTTVMLIDGSTQSQAEQTGLFLRAANDTVFVGEPSAGANGTVTNFNLPGSLNITFTGEVIEHPNGDRLQRLGLQPDVLVKPTVAGIISSKDEILNAGLHYILSMRRNSNRTEF